MPPKFRYFAAVMLAAALWGTSGTVAQLLFHQYGFTPAWLVDVRLLGAGLGLLLMVSWRLRGQVFAVWLDASSRGSLLVFALAGMLAVQYTYFAAIQAGNAASATLLQYLAPVLVALYGTAIHRRLPGLLQVVALCLSVGGIDLLVTGGTIARLNVSAAAVSWGLLSALALAFYTLYPLQLLNRWGAALVTGWSMLVAGLVLLPMVQPWHAAGIVWTGWSTACTLFVVLFGTWLPFYLYIHCLQYLEGFESTMLASLEPLVATALAVVWLGTPFNWLQALGGLGIIGAVAVLAYRQRRDRGSVIAQASDGS